MKHFGLVKFISNIKTKIKNHMFICPTVSSYQIRNCRCHIGDKCFGPIFSLQGAPLERHFQTYKFNSHHYVQFIKIKNTVMGLFKSDDVLDFYAFKMAALLRARHDL
ncbi:hypothetical protein NQD34_000985 [Periophthalmus magnuspinnatus]|nr:hypothetical protein NQD34_000985 [Periophthalmus magnuspinnatus]